MTKREKQEAFLQCYFSNFCKIFPAVEEINGNPEHYHFSLDRGTIYNWRASDKWFRDRMKWRDEDLKDLIELKGIEETMKESPNTAMMIFLHKTLLEDRGYVEKDFIREAKSLNRKKNAHRRIVRKKLKQG
ncbi:MAG: hypothetical protein GY847_01770 [Proteobacteria bacterium]|nr:hypothetical protein [Pseudomonadota bacterium]